MDCRNHIGVPAVARCAGCAEGFCGNCLVEVQGQSYCASCKIMAIKDLPPPNSAVARLCTEAKSALVTAVIGAAFLGIILGPVAIYSGFKARATLAKTPSLAGSGMANTAIILGILDCITFLAAKFIQISSAGPRF